MRALLIMLALWSFPAWAVQPNEILDDPVLEARARELSQGLRCPVCQNESIDQSNAAIARDLRILLRERLVKGDTDEEAVDFLVSRFGEFILLRPDTRGMNLILWLAAPAMFILALGIGWVTIRRRSAVVTEALSDAEKAKLDEILGS